MRLSKRGLLVAVSAIAVSASFQALSDSERQDAGAFVDANAFDEAWTGEYYTEPEESGGLRFANPEEKRRYFLESPEVGTETIEEEDAPSVVPSGRPSPGPSPTPGFALRPWFERYPSPWEFPPKVKVPFPYPSPVPSPSVVPVPPKPQAFYYYNRGSLQNGSSLDAEGRGFVKVFRDRDEAQGGRGWGTRTMIELIRKVAAEFADAYPGYERLQVADIARKGGGRTNHGSHQNGLDADIIFVRKNHREQLAFGGYGKNGFAEQFVIRSSSVRAFRDTKTGKSKSVRVYSVAPSANFDTEANFNLLRMFNRSGNVKTIFIDKVLIRELVRYAKEKKIEKDPEVESLIMKLDHEVSHTDHFHLRLFCQESDAKCVSGNAPARKRVVAKKPAPKK